MIDDGSNAAVHWKEIESEKDQFKEILFTKANSNGNLGEQLGIRLHIQNAGRESRKSKKGRKVVPENQPKSVVMERMQY